MRREARGPGWANLQAVGSRELLLHFLKLFVHTDEGGQRSTTADDEESEM